ncbi:hypothetical protein TKK_0003365 [Trichogramma kaykai]
MVETSAALIQDSSDTQTQFGNARQLDPSDSIFVFKDTLSDYEEPPSDDEEVQIYFYFYWQVYRLAL